MVTMIAIRELWKVSDQTKVHDDECGNDDVNDNFMMMMTMTMAMIAIRVLCKVSDQTKSA